MEINVYNLAKMGLGNIEDLKGIEKSFDKWKLIGQKN